MRKITIENTKSIRHLEFKIPEQKGVYLLVGANGAGKTTRLVCLDRICSLFFLKNMPKLKYFHLTMNVVDGDLSLCEHVPYVKIQNRKHYSHKDKNLPKHYSNPDNAYSFNEI